MTGPRASAARPATSATRPQSPCAASASHAASAHSAIPSSSPLARHRSNASSAEDEIAEAVLSEDVVARQYGAGRRLDQPGLVAVSELRGRDTTPTVLADRRETAGLRAWLEDRGYEARRALTVSWSIHRRAGHLAGALRLAEDLQRLFAGAEDPEQALVWALRSGLTETARKAAGAGLA